MKKVTLILMGILMSLLSFGNEITGIVSSDGELVAFANVVIKGTNIGSATDINGFFRLTNVSKGKQELEVSALGYKKFKQKIFVSELNEKLKIELKKSSYNLDQVVVTGTMKESFVRMSPVKVEVITQQFLQKVPTTNVMEVIENVNGVQKQINCGVCATNDIHINGMEGPYTLVLIDGMPIMSSLSTVYGLNGIPTSLIKQMEIIKGPSSTLYGTEAVAGVINIITKNPEDVSLLELDLQANSHQEKNLDFAIAPKMKNVSMLFSGNLHDMQNFVDENNDNFTDIPFSERLSLFNRWSFKRKDGKKTEFSAKYYNENRFGGVENWTEELRGDSVVYGESIYTERVELGATYQLPFSEDIRIDASYNYHHQDSYYGTTKYEAWQQTYFANLVWNKQISDNHDLLMGYSHRYQTFLDSSLAFVDDKKFIPALFIQDEYKSGHNFSVLSGLRIDHHKNHGLIYSPRLSLKWVPDTYTTFRLNAGTGFRLVNLFTEDHAFLTGAREVEVVEDLNPEESYNINLSMNHVFSLGNSSGTFDADLFYTYFTNKIVPDYETDANKIFYANLDGISVSRGLSLNLQQNFEVPLSFSLGATFLDVYSMNDDVKEEELFVPEFSGVFSLNYTLEKHKAKLDWTGKVTGPMNLPTYPEPFSREEVSPWFASHNLQLTKTFTSSIEAYFGVKNLLDYTQDTPLVDWKHPFGDNFDTAYAYGPLQGRRYVIGLRYRL